MGSHRLLSLCDSKGESEGLADTHWPKFRKNSRNTGNYDDAFWKKEQTINPDGYNVYLNKNLYIFINFYFYTLKMKRTSTEFEKINLRKG